MAGFRLGVVGAGNMGEAIVRGAVAAGVVAPDDILVAETRPEARGWAESLGCGVTADTAAVRGCEQIMVAVKPQDFPSVAAAVGTLERPTVVISVMAGLSSGAIRAALGEHARVVRVMPNTPCRIGVGMSAVALGEGATGADADLARSLMGAIGETTDVDERHMYAVTAVSGSGPGYVFLFAEAMERGAIDVGLPKETARLLVQQTMLGAARLMRETGEEPGALREAVTSKGGTTAAGLGVMRDGGLPDIIVRAIAAARDRGIELDA